MCGTTFWGQFYRHMPCFIPKTYIFHLKKNPEIKVPIDLIAIDDCELMTICVCHGLDKNSDEKIEIGFECFFESEEKMREGLEHRRRRSGARSAATNERMERKRKCRKPDRREAAGTPQNPTLPSSSLPKAPAKGRHFLF